MLHKISSVVSIQVLIQLGMTQQSGKGYKLDMEAEGLASLGRSMECHIHIPKNSSGYSNYTKLAHTIYMCVCVVLVVAVVVVNEIKYNYVVKSFI